MSVITFTGIAVWLVLSFLAGCVVGLALYWAACKMLIGFLSRISGPIDVTLPNASLRGVSYQYQRGYEVFRLRNWCALFVIHVPSRNEKGSAVTSKKDEAA